MDGVSAEADKWVRAFQRLGWEVRTIAGAGAADVLLPGFARERLDAPDGDVLDGNRGIAWAHFCEDALVARLRRLLEDRVGGLEKHPV